MNQGRRSLPGIAFLDYLSNLLLVFMVLFALTVVMLTTKTSRPSIETLGYYAVVVTWQAGSNDDVDTYVQDPTDQVVSFIKPTVGTMHLEQDDRGTTITNTQSYGSGQKTVFRPNAERVIITGIVPGQYVVNVQMFANRDHNRPMPVTVKLYRLIGNDEVVTTRTVVLQWGGDEKTAFRFTLNSAGRVTSINHMPKEIVYTTNPALGYARPNR